MLKRWWSTEWVKYYLVALPHYRISAKQKQNESTKNTKSRMNLYYRKYHGRYSSSTNTSLFLLNSFILPSSDQGKEMKEEKT